MGAETPPGFFLPLQILIAISFHSTQNEWENFVKNAFFEEKFTKLKKTVPVMVIVTSALVVVVSAGVPPSVALTSTVTVTDPTSASSGPVTMISAPESPNCEDAEGGCTSTTV